MGMIFEVGKASLPSTICGYAQSPQALVFADFIRIYFSAREVDESGKFISRVLYADFSKDLTQVLRVSKQPVISAGRLGTFDEHGIFPMNMLRSEKQILGYTSGWNRRVSVSVDTAIGLAISEDGGETFIRTGDGPILGPSLAEPFLVGDPFVAQFGGQYQMWYIFGTEWAQRDSGTPERVYKIGQASSDDGVAWVKRDGVKIIPDSLGPDECQALPTVIELDGRYHMYFCYRECFDFRGGAGRGYRIGYAYSDNLIDWTRNDDACGLAWSEAGWDSSMMCYPHVFACDGEVYLLYNGNNFGRDGFGVAKVEWR